MCSKCGNKSLTGYDAYQSEVNKEYSVGHVLVFKFNLSFLPLFNILPISRTYYIANHV